MPTPAQLDAFTLAFHRQAVARLHQQPALLEQALQTLKRWKSQRGATVSDPYLQRWKALLTQGPQWMEAQVCQQTEDAATLRNVSPLGFVLSARQRQQIRREAMH
jgi:hypothetical protein